MEITKVRILVGKQLGISEADAITPANLDAETRTRLLDYTFKYVADNPAQFEARQVAIAKQHVSAWGVDVPLQDQSFDWNLLANEVAANVEQAVEDVASVGQGVLTTLGMAKWLIPAAALAVVGLVFWKYYKGQSIAPIK
jgi:hypothetical protein